MKAADTARTEDHVWFINAFDSYLYVASLQPEPHDEKRKSAARAIVGNPDLTDYYPPEFYGIYNLGTLTPAFKRNVPPLFCAGPFPVVSEAMAEILERHNLGRTELRETKLLRKDRKTKALDGRYFGLAMGERKDILVPEASRDIRPKYHGDSVKYGKPWTPTDDDIAVSSGANEGVDMWIEASLQLTLMVSNRLGRALIEAGWRQALLMYRCRVVSSDASANT